MDDHSSEAYREYMNHLLDLLKKAFGSSRLSRPELERLLERKDFNLTVNFMVLFPPLPDELEDFEAGLAQYMESVGEGVDLDLKFELSPGDLDFLKINGIRF